MSYGLAGLGTDPDRGAVQTVAVAPRNLQQLRRVYGPTTWDVYEQLDVSLDPAGPDELYEIARPFLRSGGIILDAGCRGGAQLIELVREHDVAGVGIDPVEVHIAKAREAVAEAGLADSIKLHCDAIDAMPHEAGPFDLVWCRDVVPQLDDVAGALTTLARVLRPVTGRLLVYTTFGTERLDLQDAELLQRHLGVVTQNLDRLFVETTFRDAGLTVEAQKEIGTEWREYTEERTRPASQALLRLARLRRRRNLLVAEHGRDVIDHVEANLHWEVFQFLGKLESVVYVLRRS